MSEPFLDEARAIGDDLVARAVWHRDRCSWLARPVLGKDGAPALVPTLAPLGPSVYGGTAGIGLFLARLASFTDDAQHKRVAAGALRHAAHHAILGGPGAPGGANGASARFGYYGGALGIAWALHEAGERFADAPLARESRRLVRALAHHRDEPRQHDLTYGAAGAIPTLLALARRGVPEAEPLARILGEGLLAAAEPSGDALSWPLPPVTGLSFPRHLAGMSHGASGIALGLAHLHHATGEARWRDAALAAFRYERAAFDPEARTWGDLRRPFGPDGRPRVQGRWCHGAPGIGMARALAAPILKEPALVDEMRVARAATAATLRALLENPGEDATLCCGLGGLVESLWAMDEALGDARALDTARSAGAHQAARFGVEAQRRWPGFVAWPTMVQSGTHPGLMQGVAGIGHLHLRLHAGAAVPPLLAPPSP